MNAALPEHAKITVPKFPWQSSSISSTLLRPSDRSNTVGVDNRPIEVKIEALEKRIYVVDELLSAPDEKWREMSMGERDIYNNDITGWIKFLRLQRQELADEKKLFLHLVLAQKERELLEMKMRQLNPGTPGNGFSDDNVSKRAT